jgi:hypothetical protein
MEPVDNQVFAQENDLISATRPLTHLTRYALGIELRSPFTASSCLQFERRSTQGCAGASASSLLGSALCYQLIPPAIDLLDTDNAHDQKRAASSAKPDT